MVFARKTSDSLASLVKEIDKVVGKNADKKMASFVNILGKDKKAAQTAATKFAKEHNFKHVTIVVPNDLPNGPGNVPISPDADVTVMSYVRTTVKSNHAVAVGKLNKAKIKEIIADTEKILGNASKKKRKKAA